MKTIIAIDPGKNGGICSYKCTGLLGTETQIVKMPGTEKDTSDVLREMGSEITVVYLEKQGSRPMYRKGEQGKIEKLQGGRSNWTFAEGYGVLKGIIVTLGYKMILVPPGTWQRKLNLLTKKGQTPTQHKNTIKQFAQERYPQAKVTLWNADSLAILEYAKEIEK